MAWTKAKDISRYQGAWQDTGEPIVLIKMSGGDAGLYMDSNAASNYELAVKAGKAVGGYHFGGGVLSSAAEAAYFLKAMSPLAENDVYALDVEAHLASRPDVVAWVQGFVNYVHDHIGVWPLVYMNLSTLQAHDWTAVLKNCGLWLADWAVSPDANIPTHYTYVMQQYSDGPNYDHDAFFGMVDRFKAYGYHAQHAPVSSPTPTKPAPSNQPVATSSQPQLPPESPALTTPPATLEEPAPAVTAPAQVSPMEVQPTPEPASSEAAPSALMDKSPQPSRWSWFFSFFKAIWNFLVSWRK